MSVPTQLPQVAQQSESLSSFLSNAANLNPSDPWRTAFQAAHIWAKRAEEHAKKVKAVVITLFVLIILLLIGVVAATSQTARNVSRLAGETPVLNANNNNT
jgi:hypothetical protein